MSAPPLGFHRMPWFRATVTCDHLVVVQGWPEMAEPRRAAELLSAPNTLCVAVFDLDVEVGAGWRDLVVSPITPSSRTTEATLIKWAAVLGYRRLWLPDSLAELGEGPPEIGPAWVDCPVCGCRWEDDRPEFWSDVWAHGFFPVTCGACGGLLPQWQVALETPNVELFLRLPSGPADDQTPGADR